MADLKMEGWAEIKQRFADLPDNMVKIVLRPAMRESANLMKDEVANICPVGDPATDPHSGALKSSLRVTERRGTPTRVSFNVVAGAAFSAAKQTKYGEGSAYWALFVERGTVKMEARPFMRPAFEGGAQAAVDRLVIGVSDRLPEVV